MTFNWSNAGATAASVLGFDAIDSVVATGRSKGAILIQEENHSLSRLPVQVVLQQELSVRGRHTSIPLTEEPPGQRGLTVNTGGADTDGDITIDATNNTLYRNGAAVDPHKRNVHRCNACNRDPDTA